VVELAPARRVGCQCPWPSGVPPGGGPRSSRSGSV
jgi:hypothetical protein